MKSLMETFVSIDDWEVFKVDNTMHSINHASIRLLWTCNHLPPILGSNNNQPRSIRSSNLG